MTCPTRAGTPGWPPSRPPSPVRVTAGVWPPVPAPRPAPTPGSSAPRPPTAGGLGGPAPPAGRGARLPLLAPPPAPAVVDVVVLGPDGPVDLPSARGLVVAAGQARAVQLDALAPGLDRLVVHVVARRGRVAA